MPPIKRWYAEAHQPRPPRRHARDVIDGMDLFIGL